MLSAFHLPAIEPLFLTFSLIVAALLAVTAWWRHSHLKQNHILLIYLLLTFSLSLAVVSLVDLADFSLMGAGKDTQTGQFLAGLLSFTLISWIAVRQSRTYPQACVWWFVFVVAYTGLPGSMPQQIELQYKVAINSIRLLCAAAAFLLISRSKQNLNDHQYLSTLATLVVFAWLITPPGTENLLPVVPATILTVLAAVLFHQERSSAPVSAYIGLDLLLLFGMSRGITPLLKKQLGTDHPVTMLIIILLYLTFAVRVWQRRQQVPRGLVLSTLFSITILAVLELLPESYSIDQFPALLGTLLLLIIVLHRYAGTPAPEPSFWRSRLPAVGACCAFLGVFIAGFTGYTLAVMALQDNLGPARIMAHLCKTSLWPGDKRFMELVFRDEGLWPDMVRTADSPNLSILRHTRAVRPYPDRFSYTEFAGLDENRKNGVIPSSWGFRVLYGNGRHLVKQVSEASPAGRALLRRGDRILAVNGRAVEQIDDNEYIDSILENPDTPQSLVLKVRRPSGQTRIVSLISGAELADAPLTRIISTAQGPVGYLYLERFDTFRLKTVRDAFTEFSKAGIRDLVLDLRYNHGGFAGAVTLLASLIAGQRHDGGVFMKTEYNWRYTDRNSEFVISRQPESIHSRRLVVLTTDDTCSASEAIINGLRPFLPVITVGGTTCGKPFLMQDIAFNGLELHPVVARLYNSRGEGDYTGGIKPDMVVRDDLTRELGDPQEGMLKAALQLLTYR